MQVTHTACVCLYCGSARVCAQHCRACGRLSTMQGHRTCTRSVTACCCDANLRMDLARPSFLCLRGHGDLRLAADPTSALDLTSDGAAMTLAVTCPS